MTNAYFKIAKPSNEPVKNYAPGSPERASLKAKLAEMKAQKIEIPLIIGGKEIKTANLGQAVCPFEHQHVLADYHKAGPAEINLAIEAALHARKQWSEMPWQDRMAIFQRAAELISGPWRDILNAATMLNQSKNAFQAEIDSACEIADFLRFNTHFATNIYKQQPESSPGVWNRVEYRGLEGFIFAVTPFNFTAIAGNLPSAPAMMGNVAVWKPASSAVYSGYFMMKLFEAAGMPAGVINFIPGSGSEVGNIVMQNENLAGVHFTGSTAVFQNMWKTVGENIAKYKSYPRIVGETGGKDFIFAHESSNPHAVATAITRGAFEFQGQKCSAASRAYIPSNIWDSVRETLLKQTAELKVGSPEDFSNFVNAVIDKPAFDTIVEYIEYAKQSPDSEIIAGGTYDDSVGYFVDPTIIFTTDPKFKTMQEEIFGPVVTIYVYKPEDYSKMLEICDQTSPYALTGSIFSDCRYATIEAVTKLRNSAGNFYINDKCTGAVVGQQPFGGSRASGTNDKAGSELNLQRWISPRLIKETFVPPTDYKYPFLAEDK